MRKIITTIILCSMIFSTSFIYGENEQLDLEKKLNENRDSQQRLDEQIIELNSKIKEVDENKYIIKLNDTKKTKKLLNSNDKIVDDNYIEVIKDEKEIAEFIKVLVNNNLDIYEVKKEVLTLEEAFMNRAGGKKID